jgi:protein-tyrosine-phosphatase
MFLKKCGVEPKEHTPTFLSKRDMETADLILPMTHQQTEQLKDDYAQFSDKIFLLSDYAFGTQEDMRDPIGLEGGGFEKIAAKIKTAVEKIYAKLS